MRYYGFSLDLFSTLPSSLLSFTFEEGLVWTLCARFSPSSCCP